MAVLVYLDGDQRALVERVRSCGVDAWGRAAYLWQGEIEAATAIYAPARPDIVAAYVARGVPEFAPASLGEIGGFVGEAIPPEQVDRIRICCPGPHLLDSIGKSKFKPCLTIGVNASVAFVACDWWLLLDDADFMHERSLKPIGTPVCIAPRAGCWEGCEWILHERFDNLRSSRYTFCAALQIAESLKPKRVEIVGCDWIPGDGIDGDGGGLECRGERRFEAERKQAEPIMDRMRQAGIRVDRVTKASKK